MPLGATATVGGMTHRQLRIELPGNLSPDRYVGIQRAVASLLAVWYVVDISVQLDKDSGDISLIDESPA